MKLKLHKLLIFVFIISLLNCFSIFAKSKGEWINLNGKYIYSIPNQNDIDFYRLLKDSGTSYLIKFSIGNKTYPYCLCNGFFIIEEATKDKFLYYFDDQGYLKTNTKFNNGFYSNEKGIICDSSNSIINMKSYTKDAIETLVISQIGKGTVTGNSSLSKYSPPDRPRYFNQVMWFSQAYGNTYKESSPWFNVPYRNSTIGNSGCTITSLAMIVNYLNGGLNSDKWITPEELLNKLKAKYPYFSSPGLGTSPLVAVYYVCQEYGLKCVKYSKGDDIATNIANHHLYLAGIGKGEFAQGDHTIVLADVNPYTKGFYINDPGVWGELHKERYTNEYTLDFLINNANLRIDDLFEFWKEA